MKSRFWMMMFCVFITVCCLKAETYSGGSGTESDPYLISNKTDLLDLGANTADYGKYFKMTADIDLAGQTFTQAVIAPDSDSSSPGLQGTKFRGLFDGNDKNILNLSIDGGATNDYIGLFGYIGVGGEVKNLKIVDCNVSGDYCVGGLCGENCDTVLFCCLTGTVNGNNAVGGLCGLNKGEIASCYSIVTVNGSGSVGGLCGNNWDTILSCYSTGAVSGYSDVGGLCGYNTFGTISLCYSTGAVSCDSVYNAVDGFCGVNCGAISACFWDKQTSGVTTISEGAIGKTTVEMQTMETFTSAGWDFVNTWDMNGYPELQWQTVNSNEYSGGSGTESDPYLIANKVDLLDLGANTADYDKHFKLTSDIDLKGQTFTQAVIAPDTDYASAGFQGSEFTGAFDGNSKKISNLVITGEDSSTVLGLFGYIGAVAIVKNIDIKNCNIIGGNAIACLVGVSEGTITECFAGGVVSGVETVGGIVGIMLAGEVKYCSSGVNVTGSLDVGGFLGSLKSGCSILSCYSTGSVNGTSGIGGFVGWSSGQINDCYSLGGVSGDYNVGGFVGGQEQGVIARSYAIGFVNGNSSIGGFCGGSLGTISASFWDTDTSGLATSDAGVGLTTSQMKTQATFEGAGWNFDDTWRMNGYPELQWQQDDSRTLTSISLSGVRVVKENSTAYYTCTATFSDESTADVTGAATWRSDNESYAPIENGVLEAKEVSLNLPVKLTASYEYGEVTKSDDHYITIQDASVSLVSITISGDREVPEGMSSTYSCTATYSDDSTEDFTDIVTWQSDNPSYAPIEDGVLDAKEVDLDLDVTLTAIYARIGVITRRDTYDITITDGVSLTDLQIYGSSSVDEEDEKQFLCLAIYSDETQKIVPAEWSVDNSNVASINAGTGWFIANTVSSSQPCEITASYNGESDSLSVTVNNTDDYDLNLYANPSAGGSIYGGSASKVAAESHRTIRAIANEYWKFEKWSDGNESSSRVITMPYHDMSYMAYFSEVPFVVEVPKLQGQNNKKYDTRIKLYFRSVEEADGYKLYRYDSQLDTLGEFVTSSYVNSGTGSCYFNIENLSPGYESFYRMSAVKDKFESEESNLVFAKTKTSLPAVRVWARGEKNSDGVFKGSVELSVTDEDSGALCYSVNNGDRIESSDNWKFEISNTGETSMDYSVEVWREFADEKTPSTRKIIIDEVEQDFVTIAPEYRSVLVRAVDSNNAPVEYVGISLICDGKKETSYTDGNGEIEFLKIPYLSTIDLFCFASQPKLTYSVKPQHQDIKVDDSLSECIVDIVQIPVLNSISVEDYANPNTYNIITISFDDPNGLLEEVKAEICNVETPNNPETCSIDYKRSGGILKFYVPSEQGIEYEVKVWGEYSVLGVVCCTDVLTDSFTTLEYCEDQFTGQADGSRRGSFANIDEYGIDVFSTYYLKGDDGGKDKWRGISDIGNPLNFALTSDWGDESEDNTLLVIGLFKKAISSAIFSIPIDENFQDVLDSLESIDELKNATVTLDIKDISNKDECYNSSLELYVLPYESSYAYDFDIVADGTFLNAVEFKQDGWWAPDEVVFDLLKNKVEFEKYLSASSGDRFFFGIRFADKENADGNVEEPKGFIKFKTGKNEPTLNFDYKFSLSPTTEKMSLNDVPKRFSETSYSAGVTNLATAIEAYRIGRLTEYGVIKYLSGTDTITVGSESNNSVYAVRALPKMIVGMGTTNVTTQIYFNEPVKAAILVEDIESDLAIDSVDESTAVYQDQLIGNRISFMWQYPDSYAAVSYNVSLEYFQPNDCFSFAGTLYWVDYNNNLYSAVVDGDTFSLSDWDSNGLDDAWEDSMWGGNSSSSDLHADGDDPDGDDFDNYSERIAGTNPDSSNSCFVVKGPQIVNGEVLLSVDTVSERFYQLQSSTDIKDSSSWLDVGEPVAGNGKLQNLSVPSGGNDTIYYRVVVYQFKDANPTVVFNPGAHGKIISGEAFQTVEYGSDAVPPEIQADDGYGYIGWNNSCANVIENITVTAYYTQLSVDVIFLPGLHGTITSGQTFQGIGYGSAAVAPVVTADYGYCHSGWDSSFDSVTSDLTVTAVYTTKGSGTVEDPYKIYTKSDLIAVNNDLSADYILMADIDMSGETFTQAVIAPDTDSVTASFQGTKFSGSFDGGGHVIDNLTINASGTGDVCLGLFGWVQGDGSALIKDLGVESASISCGSDSFFIAGFCGVNFESIEHCYFSGVITTGDNSQNNGGLCGFSAGAIDNCYSIGEITVGVNSSGLGGLCGLNSGGTIDRSYSAMVVSCGAGSSAFGGFCGVNSGTVAMSFWDIQISTQVTSAGGSSKTTAEMQTESTFTLVGWDFIDTWHMSGYPSFVAESTESYSYSGGAGTEEDPYLIFNKTDLLALSINAGDYDKCFKMIADIDLTGELFAKAVIAPDTDFVTASFQGTKFSGKFDGEGHVIRNLTINSSGADRVCLGLFGWVQGDGSALIKNLGIEDANISCGSDSFFIAGLCGVNFESIENCYFNGVITIGDNSQNNGGLCGFNAGSVNNCYSIGEFTVGANSSGLGGFCGLNSGGAIDKSYSAMSMNVGLGSTCGGFCGSSSGTISESFWDIQNSGISTSSGAAGKTTSQMQSQTMFMEGAWDFIDIWCMNGYPAFTWQNNIKTLTSIAVSGASSMGDNVEKQYQCVATYDDGSTIDISLNTVWSEDNSHTFISNEGVLGALEVDGEETVSITANYLCNGTLQTATYNVTVFPGFYSGGSGTEADPYLIANKADLLELGATTTDYDKRFKMTADIDLAGENFTDAIIASGTLGLGFAGTQFSGTFDGKGHKILGLSINAGSTGDYIGLFGCISYGAEIKNLGVVNCDIVGEYYIGGLCGQNYGSISSSYSSGIVSGAAHYVGGFCGENDGAIASCYSAVTVTGDNRAGGLCGKNDGTISFCYSTGTTSGSDNRIGGLCGQNTDSILSSYSTGVVTGNNDVGGFCGENNGSISLSYAKGSVSGRFDIGGFCGLNAGSISYVYSIGYVDGFDCYGGLCGWDDGGTISYSFWDTQTSGQSRSMGGTGKTTSEMQTQSTFTGWDFNNIWYMSGYPALRGF
jgi:hypothetical protein